MRNEVVWCDHFQWFWWRKIRLEKLLNDIWRIFDWVVSLLVNHFVNSGKWNCQSSRFLVCEEIWGVIPYTDILVSYRQSLFVSGWYFGSIGYFRRWKRRKFWGWGWILFFRETCYDDGWSEMSNLMTYFILLQHVFIIRKCWLIFPCCFSDRIVFPFDIILVSFVNVWIGRFLSIVIGSISYSSSFVNSGTCFIKFSSWPSFFL